MPGRQFAIDSRDQQEVGSGYFAPVERTRHMLLTTFERGGAAVSAPVCGVADGDRAYFWTWNGSGSARLLQHTDAVQVTPCSTRGFLTYGLPLSATARLLHGNEASRATGKLARKHPVQHRFLIPLLQWARRRQMMIYELLADDAQGQHPEGFRAPDRRGDQSGGHAVHASREVARIYWVRTQRHRLWRGIYRLHLADVSSRDLAAGEGSRPAGTVTGTKIHTATCSSAARRALRPDDPRLDLGFHQVDDGVPGLRAHRGSASMPTYVSLIHWTEQGIKNYKDTTKRLEDFTKLAESRGGRVREALYTVGEYDIVTVTEFPDDESATAALLQVGSLGNVRTTTMRAFAADEMAGIISRTG